MFFKSHSEHNAKFLLQWNLVQYDMTRPDPTRDHTKQNQIIIRVLIRFSEIGCCDGMMLGFEFDFEERNAEKRKA